MEKPKPKQTKRTKKAEEGKTAAAPTRKAREFKSTRRSKASKDAVAVPSTRSAKDLTDPDSIALHDSYTKSIEQILEMQISVLGENGIDRPLRLVDRLAFPDHSSTGPAVSEDSIGSQETLAEEWFRSRNRRD